MPWVVLGMKDTVYLWRLSQSVNEGDDTYDSCVVAARTESDARAIHPSPYTDEEAWIKGEDSPNCWSPLGDVHVRKIGVAIGIEPGTVVCASFNAG